MKHSFDTYRLYQAGNIIKHSVRVKVRMKDLVDMDVLTTAVNTAIKRYPYFAVKLKVDEEGGYVLEPNEKAVVVLKMSDKLPALCTPEINQHLLYVDCDGKDIYFNISHTLAGGKGILPWVMTSIYTYVRDRYHITPNAPGIRKPEDSLLPGECEEPSLANIQDEKPIYTFKGTGGYLLLKDYFNGMLNPFTKKEIYWEFRFKQKDVMAYIRENDSSVAALFITLMALMLDSVLPAKAKSIGGLIAHNPQIELGLPNSHCDMLSHIRVEYTREQLQWDMEKLGTYTRAQMMLQSDSTRSNHVFYNVLKYNEAIDAIKGLKNKRAYAKKHNAGGDDDKPRATYFVNYAGRTDWGEVGDYVDAFFPIVDAHLMLEITSMSDDIFMCFQQLIGDTKYIEAFKKVLDKLHIPFKVEGPFPKRLIPHQLPKK